MKFKSYVLVVIAMLGALDGTALAQDLTYPVDTGKKEVPKNEAPKRKPSDKKAVVAQVPNGGKLQKPKLIEDPPHNLDLDADSTLPPTTDPAPSPVPAPVVEAPPPVATQPPRLPALSPAPVAAAAPSPPAPEPEKAKEQGNLGFLDGAIIPSGIGGVIFGVSPKGKEPMQVGRTTSWAGLSGGVGEQACHLNKKNGFAENFCGIFEGRTNVYLDKETLLVRDMFVGGRIHYGYFGAFLRLGAEEDIGEPLWSAFRPGSVVDTRVTLRSTFGHPGLSPIFGLWLGKYVMFRGEGNPQKKFWGARLDLHLYAEVNPYFALNFNLGAGARDAADEMGKMAEGMAGIDALFNLKPRGYDAGGNPLNWGQLKFSLYAIGERQAELLKTEDVGKIQAPMHNAMVGQAGVS